MKFLDSARYVFSRRSSAWRELVNIAYNKGVQHGWLLQIEPGDAPILTTMLLQVYFSKAFDEEFRDKILNLASSISDLEWKYIRQELEFPSFHNITTHHMRSLKSFANDIELLRSFAT